MNVHVIKHRIAEPGLVRCYACDVEIMASANETMCPDCRARWVRYLTAGGYRHARAWSDNELSILKARVIRMIRLFRI